MEVIARINTDIPAGRKALRNLQNAREGVTLEYPKPEMVIGQGTHTVDEVFDECIEMLSKHYGTDCKAIWKNIE